MAYLIKILAVFLGLFITAGHGKPPNKIKSGLTAGVNEFPHQVSLRINNKHVCGGSILDSWHILTAAHCVVTEQFIVLIDVKVLTGTVNQINPQNGEIHSVARITYHKKFHPAVYTNDIAILTLTEAMLFNEYQKPIQLSTYDIPIGSPVVVSGWGSQRLNTGINFRYLQKLHTKIISNEECEKRDGRFKIGQELICTRKAQGYSICQGDSGGPLVYKGVLIGIAARSFCDGIHPDIFMRVSSYIKWIQWNVSVR